MSEELDQINQVLYSIKSETREQREQRQALERKADIRSMIFGRYNQKILQQSNMIELKTDEKIRKENEEGMIELPELTFETHKSLVYAALMNDSKVKNPQDVKLNARGQTALFFIINPEVAGRVEKDMFEAAQDIEMIEEVLSSGIDPMIKDVYGKDCLDYGADQHQVGMVVDWTFITRTDVVDREEFTDWWQEKLDKCNKDVNYH